jgi:Lon protease-like protein
VLFPRTVLPLHIFEERYKLMIGEALASHTEFGVVLSRGQNLATAGCTAAVTTLLKRYPDGRMDILTTGKHRFEILLLNEEQAYLRAPVNYFDDKEEAEDPRLRDRALEAWQALRTVVTDERLVEPQLEDPQVSFQIAQYLPDLDFRQELLKLQSERERLKRLVEFLEEYVPRRRRIAHVNEVAPRNGHGQMPPDCRDPS